MTGRDPFSALRWNYIGIGLRTSIQFGVGVMLARTLGAEAFGSIAVSWIIIGVGNILVDCGMNATLLADASQDRNLVQLTLLVQSLGGICVYGFLYIFAVPMANFFHITAYSNLFALFGATIMFRAFGLASATLLARDLRFRTLQMGDIGGYVLGYGLIALPLAVWGQGALSIAVGQLIQAIVCTVVYWWARPIALGSWSPRAAASHAKFSAGSLGVNILWWAFYNLDNAVVGHWAGSLALSLYSRVWNLANMPMVVTNGLQAVLLSASVRHGENEESLYNRLLGAAAGVSLLAFPVLGCLVVNPNQVVVGLFGEKWRAAAELAPAVGLAMLANAQILLFGGVFVARNRLGRELVALSITAAVSLPLMVVTASTSVISFVWTISAVYMLRWAIVIYAVRDVIPFRVGAYGAAMVPGLAAAIVVGVATRLTNMAFGDGAGATDLLRTVLVGAAAMAVFARVCGPSLFSGPLRAVLSRGNRLPAIVKWWVRF